MIQIQYYRSLEELDKESLLVIPPMLHTKQQLLEQISKSLQFPSYVGNNWDAFEESLSDLSWITSSKITLAHADVPLGSSIQDLKIYLNILQEITNDSKEVVVFFPLTEKTHLMQYLT